MYLLMLSTKGGSGKSVTAKMLYIALTNMGRKVAFQDNDPQQHLARFVETLNPEPQQPDTLIVDTVGAWTTENIGLLTNISKQENHAVLVPVRPSDDDVFEAIKLHKRIKKLGLKLNLYFYMNALSQHDDKMTFINELREYNLPVLKSHISNLVAIRRADFTGKAATQIKSLLHEIF